MIKLNSYSQMINVDRIQDYSTSDGMPGIEVTINDNPTFMQRFTDLENKVLLIEAERMRDQALIKKHPAIQDAWEQFQVMLTLAKEKEKHEEEPAP